MRSQSGCGNTHRWVIPRHRSTGHGGRLVLEVSDFAPQRVDLPVLQSRRAAMSTNHLCGDGARSPLTFLFFWSAARPVSLLSAGPPTNFMTPLILSNPQSTLPCICAGVCSGWLPKWTAVAAGVAFPPMLLPRGLKGRAPGTSYALSIWSRGRCVCMRYGLPYPNEPYKQMERGFSSLQLQQQFQDLPARRHR